jgi:hypothetical protein
MFFSACSPISSKIRLIFPAASSCTRCDTQIPPGSAIASRRAAILTPSPKMSPSCSTTSPTLIPTLNSSRRSLAMSALRSTMPACTSTAQRTASTALANSAKNPSPVVFTMRPRCEAIEGSSSSRRWQLRLRSVSSSSAPINRLYPATSAARIAKSFRSARSDSNQVAPGRDCSSYQPLWTGPRQLWRRQTLPLPEATVRLSPALLASRCLSHSR